jgi:small subunit ribosomal protein S8
MMTDPIADMLTRIRNASAVRKVDVEIPFSKLKKSLAEVLRDEGYVGDVKENENSRVFRVELKYDPAGKSVIRSLKRCSTPGRRYYVGKGEIPRVLGGAGIAIISTSQGLMTDKHARSAGVGGELMCEIY